MWSQKVVAHAAPEAIQTVEVTFSVDDLEEVITIPDEWS